jgi:RNA polymerase sigma-70 factor, ECF subfamily
MNAEPSGRPSLTVGRDTARDHEKTWRTLYEETCQPLFNFLCYQTGDRDTALDLLQETYVTAMHRMSSYRGEAPVLGWLRAIALRKTLDWRRGLRRRLGHLRAFAFESASEPGAEPPGPATDAMDPAFRAALMRLSAQQRAALLLRELEELPFHEIAANLGCAEATARVHHHRACHSMRTFLRDADCDLDVIRGGRS